MFERFVLSCFVPLMLYAIFKTAVLMNQTLEDLLDKRYKVSGKGMEETWRDMLIDQSKYVIISPKALMAPVAQKYPDLIDYLAERYW